jgi:HSP20 family protein
VRVDIAGVSRDDLKVELTDGVITISGERRPLREGKPHYHAMEVQVGPFERRLRLPTPVDPKSLQAAYEHGMLEVRLTKVPERRTGSHAVKVR